MISNLVISEANKQAHIDIEKEINTIRKAWFHFEIRCSNGNIVDFVTREYITYENIEQDKADATHDN